MKKKTYKLKDLSYAGLSMTYIGSMILVFVLSIIFAAMSTMENNWVMVIVSMVIGFGLIFSLYRIGTKYGDYGLVILTAKLFQPKHIRNDFPIFDKYLIREESDLSSPNQSTKKAI